MCPVNMDGAELVFLSNDAGEEEGLGDAGVETYRDAPYASVARECGQNSADACERRPVIMCFDVLSIRKDDYPAASAQLAAVRACLDKARAKKNDKEIDFFTRAEEVLSADEIRVLRVSDANTKGLVGPAAPGTPFHSLVKASGVSNKDSDTSGGSFGIGKKAAFAASELQTVFYSTIYEELTSRTNHFLAQGKTLLVSHTGSDTRERRATGYWGLPGFMPVQDPHAVPEWLRRELVGTSVFVVGFRHVDHWFYRIAASLIQNFFCAIHRGDIQFSIDNGRLNLDQGTISACFRDPGIIQAAIDSNQLEDFEFARALYACLTSDEAMVETLNIASLGQVSLRILLRDGFPKRVCIVRNGMVITDNLAHFGDKFAKFPLYKEFVALVEPVDPQGSALIKRLENPKHDSLSAERLTDERKRADATRAIKALAVQVRAAIKKIALPKPADLTTLDELARFFADSDRSDSPPDPNADENLETYKVSTARKRSRNQSRPDPNAEGNQGGRGGNAGGGGGRGGRGAGFGHGTGGTGRIGSTREIPILDVRNLLPPDAGGEHRIVYFTPAETGTASLTVSASGIDDAQELAIVASDCGEVIGSSLQLAVRENERRMVQLRFSRAYRGPIEISAMRVADTDFGHEDQ